jgi:hypothetical protein
MALPPRLEKELAELREHYNITVHEEPEIINVIFAEFSVGGGYTLTHSDLLLRIPRSYADAGPDMFWTATDLRLCNGEVPHTADAIEQYVGRAWRRFSWHRPSSCPWNPNTDNLHGQLEFIRRRLRERK